MSTKRQEIQAKAEKIASPVLAEMGVELVDVEYTAHGGQTLRLYLDRPGGITVDELQEASQAVEKVLEIEEFLQGRYRLEVSSPGIDRPWKGREDFLKNIGNRATVKLRSPLPDGRRSVKGTLLAVGEGVITLSLDEGGEIDIPLDGIDRARPEIDWDRLLKASDRPSRKRSHARRSS